MITVGLLSFIVLGLLAMFQQTQRAFRTGMAYNDILESGRNAGELMGSEIAQMTPSRFPDFIIGNSFFRTTNCYAQVSPLFPTPLQQGLAGTSLAGQPGLQECRTNVVQNFFFLSQFNQTWTGVGYAVLPPFRDAGVGTLYRYSLTTTRSNAPFLSGYFQNALQLAVQNVAQGLPVTNMSRLADGVVHMRLQAFATNGFPLLFRSFATNGVFTVSTNGIVLPSNLYSNVGKIYNSRTAGTVARGVVDYYFVSNAVPGSLELELGVIEPRVVDRFRALPTSPPQLQRNYLSNHLAQVHLFRQRIPIRNVDFSAYQ
jgi:hypothetical protein